MKSLIVLTSILLILSSCEKDHETIPSIPEKLDISIIASLIGKSITDSKAALDEYDLISEEVTLGVTSLTYLARTKESIFDLMIDFNSNNSCKEIKGLSLMDTTYSAKINLARDMSNRFFKIVYNQSYVYYGLWFYDYGISKRTFYSQVDYWNYIRDNGVDDKVIEYWALSSDKISFLCYDNTLKQIYFQIR